MSSQLSVMAVISDEFEAQRALKLLEAKKNFIIIALSVSAESYISQRFPSWQNPLYDLVCREKYKSSKYTFENFKDSYDFCNDTSYKYIRDRLGYFLAELERSLDLAREAIHKFKPTFLIIGALKNFPGSSVVDGTLKTNAFFLLAKEMKIPYSLIGRVGKKFSFQQTVGKKIQLFRYLHKQGIQGDCDLLILATPRHLIQMASIINEIKRRGINLTILTYNVTLVLKKKLDDNFTFYFEKERLTDSRIGKEVKKTQKRLERDKPWDKFTSNKYKNDSTAINYIKDKIQNIIKNETTEIFTDIYLAQKVLSRLNPKALLTTTDPDSKILPYIDKARESGIKTICIQHGAFYGKDSPAIYPVSDFFIAWSEISKNWLKRSDYFKHLKILVGNSPFHHYPNISKKIPGNTALTILYLATKQPIVDKGLVSYYLKILFGTLSKVDLDFNLIVRVHPYQDMSSLEPLIKNFNHRASFSNDQPLEEVISKSDLVIWENTTAGFDAMLSGKPTVYFNPYSQEDFYNVKGYDASLPILGENDIYEKLPQFIKDKNQWRKYSKNGKDFAIKYLGLNRPHSKLAEIISTIIKK